MSLSSTTRTVTRSVMDVWRKTTASRDQQQLSCRFARLEEAVRFGGLTERHLAIDADAQLAASNPLEDVVRAPQQFVATNRIVCEARPGEIDGVLRKPRGIDR